MEDKKLYMTMLFDFFGELLTEKQREYFDLYYNEDMSLSEIAENSGISRQGVRDMLVRAENALCAYEEKTGVVARFMSMRRSIGLIERRLDEAEKEPCRAAAVISEVKAELEALKG